MIEATEEEKTRGRRMMAEARERMDRRAQEMIEERQ